MKSKLLLAIVCIVLLGSAEAADSVNLKVTGKLSMGACTPELDGGGVIDLGHVSVKNLSPDGTVAYFSPGYQHKKINFNISCTTDTKIGFTLTDNEPGTVPSTMTSYNAAYGLGKTSDNKDIGLYELFFSAATVDGQKGKTIYTSLTNPGTWAEVNGIYPTLYLYAFAKDGQTTPYTGKLFNLTMDTDYFFEKTVVDSVQDELAFLGSVTFTLMYM